MNQINKMKAKNDDVIYLYSSKKKTPDDLNSKYKLNDPYCTCGCEMLKASKGWNCPSCKSHKPKYEKN